MILLLQGHAAADDTEVTLDEKFQDISSRGQAGTGWLQGKQHG